MKRGMKMVWMLTRTDFYLPVLLHFGAALVSRWLSVVDLIALRGSSSLGFSTLSSIVFTLAPRQMMND
jgi:hypothetical protein